MYMDKLMDSGDIISQEEAGLIKDGLKILQDKYRAGQLTFSISNEDIHMNIESLLNIVLNFKKLQMSLMQK